MPSTWYNALFSIGTTVIFLGDGKNGGDKSCTAQNTALPWYYVLCAMHLIYADVCTTTIAASTFLTGSITAVHVDPEIDSSVLQ